MKVVAELSYERIKRIGAADGANSEVFLVRDLQTNEVCVAKEIQKPAGAAVEDYWRECRLMALSVNSHVVPLKAGCEHQDRVCLLMPFLPNGSLADRIRTGPLSLRAVQRVGIEMLYGLGQVHTRGIIHFDLKPTNVMFDAQGRALIADFGQSRLRGGLGAVEAPPMYATAIPPEVWTSLVGTTLSDIYQAGLTLYRAAVGDADYHAQVARLQDDSALRDAVVRGRFPNRKFPPHVPLSLRRVILKALAVDPAERYASADDFQEALRRVSLPIDWSMDVAADSVVWNGVRAVGRPLMVTLDRRGALHSVAVYTVNGKKPRRKVEFCRAGLGTDAAWKYLGEVFKRLALAP